MPLFVSMSVITDSMIGEKEKRTLDNLLVSPLSNIGIAPGKFLPTAILVALQSFLWLAIAPVLFFFLCARDRKAEGIMFKWMGA